LVGYTGKENVFPAHVMKTYGGVVSGKAKLQKLMRKDVFVKQVDMKFA